MFDVNDVLKAQEALNAAIDESIRQSMDLIQPQKDFLGQTDFLGSKIKLHPKMITPVNKSNLFNITFNNGMPSPTTSLRASHQKNLKLKKVKSKRYCNWEKTVKKELDQTIY